MPLVQINDPNKKAWIITGILVGCMFAATIIIIIIWGFTQKWIPKAKRYTCSDDFQCIETSDGRFPTKDLCNSQCTRPKFDSYVCDSNSGMCLGRDTSSSPTPSPNMSLAQCQSQGGWKYDENNKAVKSGGPCKKLVYGGKPKNPPPFLFSGISLIKWDPASDISSNFQESNLKGWTITLADFGKSSMFHMGDIDESEMCPFYANENIFINKTSPCSVNGFGDQTLPTGNYFVLMFSIIFINPVTLGFSGDNVNFVNKNMELQIDGTITLRGDDPKNSQTIELNNIATTNNIVTNKNCINWPENKSKDQTGMNACIYFSGPDTNFQLKHKGINKTIPGTLFMIPFNVPNGVANWPTWLVTEIIISLDIGIINAQSQIKTIKHVNITIDPLKDYTNDCNKIIATGPPGVTPACKKSPSPGITPGKSIYVSPPPSKR